MRGTILARLPLPGYCRTSGRPAPGEEKECTMPTTSGDPGPGSAGRSVEKKRDTREVVRLVAAGVGLILLVAFVLDNSQTVKVGFVVFSTQLSLIWVLLIAAVLGAVVDRLVILLRQRRKKAAT
jgi:uncharacterized integral membrane protein